MSRVLLQRQGCLRHPSIFLTPVAILAPPSSTWASVCTGYAVYRDGGGGICTLGMQFILADKSGAGSGKKRKDVEKVHAALPPEVREAIMREGRKESARKEGPRPAPVLPQKPPLSPPTGGDKPPDPTSTVTDKLWKQKERHYAYVSQLASDIAATLKDDFPRRCRER